MKLTLKNFSHIALAALLVLSIGLSACSPKPEKMGYYPGTLTSALPNYAYSPMVFTATSQTLTQSLGGVGSATLEIYGPATAASITCKASNDGGTTYFGIPYSDGTITATYNLVKGIAAATWSYSGTAVLYYINLAGMTNVECITSSTFTGASATVQITATSNRGIF